MSFPQFKNIKYLAHFGFWIFMFFMIFDYHFVLDNGFKAIGLTFLEISTYGLVVYLNLLILIPLYLKRGKILIYLISITILYISYILLLQWTGIEGLLYVNGGWRNILSMVINVSLFLMISTLFWYFTQWQIERENGLKLKSERLENEMNFLQSQIGPHFIFNSLNNIYSLAIQKHENTAPMVAKLSSLLSHVLYESNKKDILLSKELDTIKEFIDLNLLRKIKSQNIDFFIQGSIDGWKMVPMVLLNFTENAFKHSHIDHDENAWIKIYGEISEGGLFQFLIENSCHEMVYNDSNDNIGLSNAKKNLAINYSDKYSLDIGIKENIFAVDLSIQLTK